MFIDRTPREDDPWLRLKVGSFSAGAVLALAGIYFDSGWMIWVAIGVLALGFAARFLPASDGAEASSEEVET